MSIAVDRFAGGRFSAVFHPPQPAAAAAKAQLPPVMEAPLPPLMEAPACSSSSLGRDSDATAAKDGAGCDEDGEVQSEYRGSGLSGGGLETLEEALPISRGISKFYNGKSKSFAYLADAVSYPVKDIGKAENSYTRKRKNLLAFSLMYEMSRSATLLSAEEGSPKRLANSDRLTGSSPRSSSSNDSEEHELPPLPYSRRTISNSPASSISASPLSSPQRSSGPMRSLSMMDLRRLQRSSSSARLREKHKTE